MKRLVSVLSILLFLTACKSTDTKIEEAILEEMEEKYHLTEVEVTAIKEKNVQGAFVAYLFGRVLGGKDYEVEMEVADSVSTRFSGIVNNRELKLKNEDYIPRKHEKLLETSVAYQENIEELARRGVLVDEVVEGYHRKLSKQGIRLLHYEVESEDELFNMAKLYDVLEDLSAEILEEIDWKFELDLTLPAENKILFKDESEVEVFEIEMSYDEDREVLEQLESTMIAAELNLAFDEEIVEKIRVLGLNPVQSIFHNRPETTETEYIHEILIEEANDVTEEMVLELVELLKDEGFRLSYLSFFNPNVPYEAVEVNEINTLADVEQKLFRE